MHPSYSCGARIRLARNMVGLSRKEVEERFSISANTLQSWESDKNTLTQKGAKRLNEVFIQLGLLCSEEWFLSGNGQMPMLLKEKLSLPIDINEDICILREIEVFRAINPDPIVITISDNVMEPIYEIGDYVGGNTK